MCECIPRWCAADVMLAKVDGVLNAIEVQTDLAGRVLFHGRGAGDMPTTSAVLADVAQIARNLVSGVEAPPLPALDADVRISPMDALETKYYMRMNVVERPGVFAQILKVLGDLDISIASAIQKETDDAGTSRRDSPHDPPRQGSLGAERVAKSSTSSK